MQGNVAEMRLDLLPEEYMNLDTWHKVGKEKTPGTAAVRTKV